MNFENFPAFFIAHELAHQWWGQAVGWKNYHEQWLSEGVRAVLRVLYAEKDREGSLPGVLRQMRRTAMEDVTSGPVYLGYRLGHIQGDDGFSARLSTTRARWSLHMLRRLIGDDAFFGGSARSISSGNSRRPAPTISQGHGTCRGRDLQRFFDTWVFGSAITRTSSSRIIARDPATVRFEQPDDVVDVPITVAITYESGAVDSVVVVLATSTPSGDSLEGSCAGTIAANADNAALVEIDR